MTSRGSEKKGSNNERNMNMRVEPHVHERNHMGTGERGKASKPTKEKKYETQTLRTGRNEETMNVIWGN